MSKCSVNKMLAVNNYHSPFQETGNKPQIHCMYVFVNPQQSDCIPINVLLCVSVYSIKFFYQIFIMYEESGLTINMFVHECVCVSVCNILPQHACILSAILVTGVR